MPSECHLGRDGPQAPAGQAQRPHSDDRRLLFRLHLKGAVGRDRLAKWDDAAQVAAPRALVGLHHGPALQDTIALGLGDGRQDGEDQLGYL